MSYEDILHDLLVGSGKSVSTAESCTGGLIAHKITSVAGSSAYFCGSVVCYTNEIKMRILGVSERSIAEHTEVSHDVACQMAEGVCRLMQTDYAVATTGYAGPGGGTISQPVGTVWIAVATRKGAVAQQFHFSGSRSEVIEAAAQKALSLLTVCISSDKDAIVV